MAANASITDYEDEVRVRLLARGLGAATLSLCPVWPRLCSWCRCPGLLPVSPHCARSPSAPRVTLSSAGPSVSRQTVSIFFGMKSGQDMLCAGIEQSLEFWNH